MKKGLIVISLITISLFFSDLSFAKKSKRRAAKRAGLISTTTNAAVNVTESAVQTPGKILRAL